MIEKHIYKVTFINQGKVYEIFAEKVSHGGLFGFVEVEGLLFGEKTSVVVDPSEERLKTEFAGVKRFYVPLHAIVRIDEMEKRGTNKVTDLPAGGTATVTPFPSGLYTPPGGPGKT